MRAVRLPTLKGRKKLFQNSGEVDGRGAIFICALLWEHVSTRPHGKCGT